MIILVTIEGTGSDNFLLSNSVRKLAKDFKFYLKVSVEESGEEGGKKNSIPSKLVPGLIK